MRHPFWKSALVGVSFIALVSFSLGTGHAADESKTQDVIKELGRLYADFEYEQAFVVIQRARSLSRDVDGKVALSLYEGILWCEMGNFILGQVTFREALLVRPDVKLPIQVAPKVEKSFEATRLAVAHEKALLTALSKPAPVAGPPAPRGSGARAQAPQGSPPPASVNSAVSRTPSAPTAATSKQPDVEVDIAPARAVVMKRLSSIPERFGDMSSVLPLSSLQQLSAIGRQIRSASSKEELQAASSSIDAWEARNLGTARPTR